MNIGMITCNYYMRVYNYHQPEAFNWSAMTDRWRETFHKDDFLSLANEIRGMGYNALEIWEPTFSYKKYCEDDAKALSGELAAIGFNTVAYCIGGWSNAAADQVEPAYKFAKALGANVVTGCIAKPGMDELLSVIEAMGHKYGIRYAIENHPSPNLESPEEVYEAFAPYQMIGANLDTGIYNMQGYNILHAMDLFGDKIFHTHFKDTMKGGEGCLPIGDGDAPLAEALKLFKARGYTDMVSVEFEYPTDPTDGLKKSIAFIKDHV